MFWFKFLDYFFLLFHLLLVFFNLFGWIWPRTRKWNLLTLLITGGSWFLLGLFYGIGYCPLTDWHWQVLAKLGHIPDATSYMQYLFLRVFGLSFNARLVDSATLLSYLAALAVSVTLNVRDFRKKKSTQELQIH